METGDIGELVMTRGPRMCRGACLLVCDPLHCEWLRIDRADPRIRVSRELLEQMLIYGSGPHADLKPGPGAVQIPAPASKDTPALSAWIDALASNLEGWLLTIRAENRTVLYRIIAKDLHGLAYVAEWPD